MSEMSSEEGCQEVMSTYDGYDYDVLSMDKTILTYYDTALSRDTLDSKQRKTLKGKLQQLTKGKDNEGKLLLRTSDVAYLHTCLNDSADDHSSHIYLYELMELSQLHLPSPTPMVRSPKYEEKMRRLKLLADEAEYQKMTKNISMAGQPAEDIGKELKQMDSQATFLLNFVLTVLGAFVFGYKGVEYSLATPNVSLQLTVGVTLATIVFFADVYFIIKKYV